MTTWLASLYDGLERRLHGARSARTIGAVLAFTFLASLVVIEIGRQGFLPDPLADFIPDSHFHAIDFAFTALMLFEVMLLVLALAHSVTASAGKQFEILSLILLRLSFKELKSLLAVTDGNLSMHARKLENAGYVTCEKKFDGRIPKTEYIITPLGRKSLKRYLTHMEALLRATSR